MPTLLDVNQASTVIDAAALGLIGLALASVLIRQLETAIAFLALQGVLLSIASAAAALAEMDWRAWSAFLIATLVKVVAIPALLWFVLGRVATTHEVESVVPIKLAFPIAIGLTALAFWVTQPFTTAAEQGEHGFDAPNALPAALALLLMGLFLMAGRKGALTQVTGLVTMENGIYIGALAATGGLPIAVELGIAMDILTGAAMLALVTHEMNRVFRSTDIDRLRSLRG